jgi:hypothetical protein
MPSEHSSDVRFEIGHVLFIDIVGYSKLLIEEQKERLNQLTEIVLATAVRHLRAVPHNETNGYPMPMHLRPRWRSSDGRNS